MYDPTKLFHIGIRTANIEQTMEEIGRSADVTWTSMQTEPRSSWVPGKGQIEWAVRFVYSCEGPVHYELLEGERGSIWDGHDVPGAHHFGVWTDDVKGDTERLLAVGWTLELAGASPEKGYGRFTYVRSPTGFLLEPVALENKPRFERWWAGGSFRDTAAPPS
jgi:Glyoxalase/Bleomycin resistance protein/Dioxygenase superfamily